MNIIVCVKGIPRRLVKGLASDSIQCKILNPYDIYALQQACKIRDLFGGTVKCVSMGDKSIDSALRQCVAIGADLVYRVSDPCFSGSDTVATSLILSAAIISLGKADLIICGGKSIDGNTSQVGPGLSANLSIPSITNVSKVTSISENTIICDRKNNNFIECIQSTLPALITYNDFETKFSPKSLLTLNKSYNALINVINRNDLDLAEEVCGLAGSKTEVISTYIPNVSKCTQIIDGTINDKSREIVKLLCSLN